MPYKLFRVKVTKTHTKTFAGLVLANNKETAIEELMSDMGHNKKVISFIEQDSEPEVDGRAVELVEKNANQT